MEEYDFLEMRNMTKRFPGVLALDDVTLKLRKGEVLALLGENGAGKSTLIKILAGAFIPDEGEIYIEGNPVVLKSPTDALKFGVSVIYQELNYLNNLSIAENIFLGRIPKKISGQVNWKELKQKTKKLLEEVGLEYDPFTPVSSLSVGEKQLLEIARALTREMKILVMDEPTAALSEKEVKNLFSLIKKLSGNGLSIIYISHRLDEVFEVSGRVQIMRDGKTVGLLETAATNKNELVELMVGRKISNMYPKADIQIEGPLMRVQNVSTNKVKDISFEVRKGEILGLFGLMGCGRTDLIESIFGIGKIKSGYVEINDKKMCFKTPKEAIKAGLAYVPNERKSAGLILGQSVKSNITVTHLKEIDSIYRINTKKENELVRKWVDELNIKTPDINNDIDSLSGGNQQKVVLAKWLITNPKVLMLNEPTRGIDVGAKTEIYRLMEEICGKGLGVIMISSELPEMLAIADRILVISEGRHMGTFDRKESTQKLLMEAAIGGIN